MFKFLSLLLSSKPPANEPPTNKMHLSALEAQWEYEMGLFQNTRGVMHLQAAGDVIYRALNTAHGEHFAVVALQAGGWPRPWERCFSHPPSNGSIAEHNAILHDTLKDIGEAIKPWEFIPTRNMISTIDLILIRRNRKNSPFIPYGKPADSGAWPHDKAV